MKEQFVIAYDFGTSGVKAVLISFSRQVKATANGTYNLYVPQEGYAEQDPEEYWSAVCDTTKTVLHENDIDASQICGIVFGTMWKGIIPVSADGEVLCRSIIWLDTRAEEQANKINCALDTDKYSGADYWPKLMWLKENKPEIVDKAQMILEVNAFLKWKATGECVSDISNNFAKSFDENIDSQYEELFNIIGIDRNKFPRWAGSEEKVGEITAKAAQELGLLEGTPVFAGCSDITGITIGSGSSKLGTTHAYFGSSGWLGYSVTHGNEAPYIASFDFSRDIAVPLGLNAAGLALNWVVDNLYGEEKKKMGDYVYDLINSEVETVAPGSEGMLATPWFYGELKPVFGSEARGCFLNMNATHTRKHMARAMMEGIIYMMKATERYCDEGLELVSADTITAVGGGAKSDVWMQMMADVLNKTIQVPYWPRHAGAMGVAACAFVGLGIYKDFDDFSEKTQIERTFKPNPENAAVYEQGYELFSKLFEMQKPIFDTLNI